VAYLVFKCIANTLEKGIRTAVKKHGLYEVVMAGGVMANRFIRERLQERLKGSGIKLLWAPTNLSTDNAVGTALLTRKCYYYDQEMGVCLEQ